MASFLDLWKAMLKTADKERGDKLKDDSGISKLLGELDSLMNIKSKEMADLDKARVAAYKASTTLETFAKAPPVAQEVRFRSTILTFAKNIDKLENDLQAQKAILAQNLGKIDELYLRLMKLRALLDSCSDQASELEEATKAHLLAGSGDPKTFAALEKLHKKLDQEDTKLRAELKAIFDEAQKVKKS